MNTNLHPRYKFTKNEFRRKLNQNKINLRDEYPNCTTKNLGDWLYKNHKDIFDKEHTKWITS